MWGCLPSSEPTVTHPMSPVSAYMYPRTTFCGLPQCVKPRWPWPWYMAKVTPYLTTEAYCRTFLVHVGSPVILQLWCTSRPNTIHIFLSFTHFYYYVLTTKTGHSLGTAPCDRGKATGGLSYRSTHEQVATQMEYLSFPKPRYLILAVHSCLCSTPRGSLLISLLALALLAQLIVLSDLRCVTGWLTTIDRYTEARMALLSEGMVWRFSYGVKPFSAQMFSPLGFFRWGSL